MDVLDRIVELRRRGERFAIATVVARKAPVSSQLGDKAIVLEDGTMEGFVGGACSREIVRKQAAEVLALERPRLVRISPDPLPPEAADNHDEICVPMTCASEGAVDVYIEPQLEKKRMVIAGSSPIALALTRQAQFHGYEVSLVCEADERETVRFGLHGSTVELLDLATLATWVADLPETVTASMDVVVASMGHYDEEALAALLTLNPRFLGLVSSRKRGETVMNLLKDTGVSQESLANVRNPVGLDIGAKTPNEVAISILAEMISLRRQAAFAFEKALTPTNESIDPVCGMTVNVETAKHSAEHKDKTYYFCCPNCRHHFLKDPESYLQGAAH